jgi:hypothetical protein
VGFEPTTPGLKDRNSSSKPVSPCHVGTGFVSEHCHLRPVLRLFVQAFVAQYGDKMATNSKAPVPNMAPDRVCTGVAGLGEVAVLKFGPRRPRVS